MTKLTTTLFAVCLMAAAGTTFAQDAMKKDDAMHKNMTMSECNDHMAMQKKEMKKDMASMAMDKECGAVMKKDQMKSGDMMKKEEGKMKK